MALHIIRPINAIMRCKVLLHSAFIALLTVASLSLSAQDCDGNVPFFNVDLSSAVDAVFYSPPVQRDGNCCGTTAPDKCISFSVTLHPDAVGIIFDICDGAMPPGALFYQVNCGPATAVGNVLCLSGPGPHLITFCKPGNNTNIYCITSVPGPGVGPNQVASDGCNATIEAIGYDPATLVWNSVFPGPQGMYNNLMSCTNCPAPIITAPANFPPSIDFMVCGSPMGGCEVTPYCETVTVYFASSLAVSILPEIPTICFGSTGVEVSAIGSGGFPPYTLTWSNGTVGTSTFINSPGTYTVFISDGSGCPPASHTFNVTQYANPVLANAGNDIYMCTASNTVLLNGTVSGINQGIWTGGNGTFSPGPGTLNAQYIPTAAEITAGSVSLTLSVYPFGCPSASDVVNVYFAPPMQVVILPEVPTICFGTNGVQVSALASGGYPPYSYSWSNNTSGNITFIESGGTYTISVSDASNCPPVTYTFDVLEYAVPVNANAGADIFVCTGTNTVQLNGTINGVSEGIWTGGNGTFSPNTGSLNAQYTATAAEIASGSVSLTLSVYPFGCPSFSDVVIVNFVQFASIVSGLIQNVGCAGESTGAIQVNVVGNDGPYTFDWGGSLPNTNQLSNLATGTYNVLIYNQYGCSFSTSFIVSEPPPLTFNMETLLQPLCYNIPNGLASVVASGGTPPYEYTWSIPGNAESTLGGLGPGSYLAMVEDQNGCTQNLSFDIVAPTQIEIITSGDVQLCPQSSAMISALANGGTGALTYNWNQGLGNASSHQVSPSTSQTYSVYASDANGCLSDFETIEVVVVTMDQSLISMNPPQSICPGQSTTFSVTYNGQFAPYYYQWSPLLANSPGPHTVSPSSSMTYTVTISDYCNNSLSVSVPIEVYPQPVIDLPAFLGQGCAPLTLNFLDNQNVGSEFTHTWTITGVDVLQGNPAQYTFTGEGLFHVWLSVTNSSGCTAMSTQPSFVSIVPAPEANFEASPWLADIDEPEITFTNTSTGDVIGQWWNFGNGTISTIQNPVYAYPDTGHYPVTLLVENVFGCTDQITKYIRINPVYEIIIPNAFSPGATGGNGFYNPLNTDNNIFYPFADYVEEFKMSIFNRWGELIFESLDIKYGWDGTYRGEPQPQDVYVYKIEFGFSDGKNVTRVGDITLFR
jgi:gliding motility-associated-like protein